jgi:S-formylglutathione hydrolase FrmB
MRAIYIDCGTSDYPGIEDNRKLHEKLNSLGIDHVYKEFAGDHACCVMASTGDALEVFSKAMAFEMLPKVSVQPRGMLTTTWGEMKRK